MLQLIERNGALESRNFDLGSSGTFGSTYDNENNNFDNDNGEGLALRDRIIEAQRLQLKKLGKRKAAAPPELARMYTELEALRLAEARPPMAALPSIPANFGERIRPVVGSAAVLPMSAEEQEQPEQTAGSATTTAPAPPPPSGGRGVFGMFGRGKKQQQQATLPAILPDPTTEATSPRLSRLSASPIPHGDEKKTSAPPPSPSSRRRSPVQPPAKSASKMPPTKMPSPPPKAAPPALLPSPSPPSLPTTPDEAPQTLASSGALSRMLPRSRSSTVLEMRPGSSDDSDSASDSTSDLASEIASDDEDTAAALMEAWSNDGRSLAGSLGGSLNSARRHTVTAGSRGSVGAAANDPLNNTYTKTRPMPSSSSTTNTTLGVPAYTTPATSPSAPTAVHSRRALRGGSPKGLVSLDSPPPSAQSSPPISIAASPASNPAGKRSSPTKYGSVSPRVGRRGAGEGRASPYKASGPHASTSPRKSPHRSPRAGGASSLAPVTIPRGRVQTSPTKSSQHQVKLTAASPVKRISAKTKGRAPMAGGTGLFDLSIQASPYGVQTRQPRGIRYA